MSDTKAGKLRFVEARTVRELAERLEAALRQAPKALLAGVSNEAFLAQIACVRTMTEGLEAEIEALEKFFAL